MEGGIERGAYLIGTIGVKLYNRGGGAGGLKTGRVLN